MSLTDGNFDGFWLETIAKSIHCLFPLLALILLIVGIKRNAIYYVISALWLSLIALIIHFQTSGGQIFGSYFNYANAAIYSINLVILFVALIRIISHLSIESDVFRYLSSFAKALVVIGSLLLMINLWMNAFFIDNRMLGTPIMQVATFKKLDYCGYRYVFYKVNSDGSVMYLCPNYYGLVPAVGRLAVSPDFIATQLSLPSKKEMLLKQQHGN